MSPEAFFKFMGGRASSATSTITPTASSDAREEAEAAVAAAHSAEDVQAGNSLEGSAADVYAFGMVLWEMLAAGAPHGGSSLPLLRQYVCCLFVCLFVGFVRSC